MSIVALVNNVSQIPKINGKLLPPIVTSTGLKQGDNLSPILFDIFFDDVDLIFDSKCEPVVLSDELSLNHLLYADDMAIISLSSEGLQHSLDNLHEYCKVWYLDVSIKKQKLLFLIALEEYLNNFSLSMMVSLLKEFKYLGTTLSPSGSLFLAKEKLRKQANKAYFPVISALQKIDFDAVTSLKLFDSLIKPILTYNWEF